jgi:hypothetical protein
MFIVLRQERSVEATWGGEDGGQEVLRHVDGVGVAENVFQYVLRHHQERGFERRKKTMVHGFAELVVDFGPVRSVGSIWGQQFIPLFLGFVSSTGGHLQPNRPVREWLLADNLHSLR